MATWSGFRHLTQQVIKSFCEFALLTRARNMQCARPISHMCLARAVVHGDPLTVHHTELELYGAAKS